MDALKSFFSPKANLDNAKNNLSILVTGKDPTNTDRVVSEAERAFKALTLPVSTMEALWGGLLWVGKKTTHLAKQGLESTTKQVQLSASNHFENSQDSEVQRVKTPMEKYEAAQLRMIEIFPKYISQEPPPSTSSRVIHESKKKSGLDVPVERMPNGRVYVILKGEEFVLGRGFMKTVRIGMDMAKLTHIAHSKILIKPKRDMTTEQVRADTLNEIAINQELDHPNVVKMLYFCEYTSKDGTQIFSLAFEYLNSGELRDFILSPDFQKLESKELWGIVKDIFTGVKYLHDKLIHHRDLKPENILINKRADGTYTAKICDMGFARKLEDEKRDPQESGSIEYSSPEFVQGAIQISKARANFRNGINKIQARIDIKEGTKLVADLATDVWALGIILFVIRHGGLPKFLFGPKGECDAGHIMNALLDLTDDKIKPYFPTIDEDSLEHLNRQMLLMNPQARPSVTEALFQIENFMANNAEFK